MAAAPWPVVAEQASDTLAQVQVLAGEGDARVLTGLMPTARAQQVVLQLHAMLDATVAAQPHLTPTVLLRLQLVEALCAAWVAGWRSG
jgi:hypothetical protein